MRKSPSSQLSLLAVAPTIPPKRSAVRNLSPVRAAVKPAAVKAAKSAEKSRAGEKKTPRARAMPEPSQIAAAGGALWKMSGKNGVAYVRDAALAGELLAVETRKLTQAAMAVYYDKRGKPFAWQVRFDAERWDEILRRLA